MTDTTKTAKAEEAKTSAPKQTASTAAKDAAKSTAKKEPGFTVTCFQAGGRRRGGQHWDEGPTKIAASKMTDKLRAALDADPLFAVIEG